MTMEKSEDDVLPTSDRLHNKNCFDYLRNLKVPQILLDNLPIELADLAKIKDAHYNPDYPYGDFYKKLFDHIDNQTFIDALYKKLPEPDHAEIEYKLRLAEATLEQQNTVKDQHPENMQGFMKSFRERLIPKEVNRLQEERKKLSELDDFFISIYANDNRNLEKTYKAIKDFTIDQVPVSKGIKSAIAKHLEDLEGKEALINKNSQSPLQTESKFSRGMSVISSNYKPQHTTSLATVRHYEWNKNHPVKEYRFGTQGQRDEGVVQVSPLFKQFLKIQDQRAKQPTAEQPTQEKPSHITHIYFNNLGRDRTDFEGEKEKRLTEALERLEEDHPNVAVITLPADKGLMDHHDYQKTTPTLPYNTVREDLIALASQDPKYDHPIKDFYISQRIREAIFKKEDSNYDIEDEKAKLGELVDNSFRALGIKEGTPLSPSQRQAVLFHFMKCELTNLIIDKLKPQEPGELSINFSCKDAIDRGGVSSAYYNLMNSFKSPAPMNREEFERALHAAPTMVKGRGMNDHLNIIWNAVNLYVNTNYGALKKDDAKSWLIEWRDMNCPHERVEELLKHRLPELQDELNECGKQSESIDNGKKILDMISKQIDQGVSGKRLLLEAAVRTPAMALNTAKDDGKRYDELSDKLKVASPVFNQIAGYMKYLVGLAIKALTRGKDNDMLTKGWATAQAGVESESRKKLQLEMKKQVSQLRTTQSTEVDKKNRLTEDVDQENHTSSLFNSRVST